MSFLNQQFNQIVPTKQQQLLNTTNQIKNLSKTCFEQLLKTQEQGIKLLWNHHSLTPQEIIDSLGDDAIKIFQFHGKMTDYINTIATIENINVNLSYPKYSFTIDDQGKITVSDQPYGS
jgi:hypothetical protein